MSSETALALWGEAAVRRALGEPNPEPVAEELAGEVARKADELRDDEALASWARSLPWPRFCAVVRIVAGVTREDLLGGAEA